MACTPGIFEVENSFPSIGARYWGDCKSAGIRAPVPAIFENPIGSSLSAGQYGIQEFHGSISYLYLYSSVSNHQGKVIISTQSASDFSWHIPSLHTTNPCLVPLPYSSALLSESEASEYGPSPRASLTTRAPKRIPSLELLAAKLGLSDEHLDQPEPDPEVAEDEPYFLLPLYDKAVEAGHDFALTAELSRDPGGLGVSWFLDGLPLVAENSEKHTFVCEGTVHVLLVHDVDENDEGEYRVVAGRRALDAYITVIPIGKER